MVIEMIENEPPFFSEPPLMAMKKIRDQQPATLKNPEKVWLTYWTLFCLRWAHLIYWNTCFCSLSRGLPSILFSEYSIIEVSVKMFNFFMYLFPTSCCYIFRYLALHTLNLQLFFRNIYKRLPFQFWYQWEYHLPCKTPIKELSLN